MRERRFNRRYSREESGDFTDQDYSNNERVFFDPALTMEAVTENLRARFQTVGIISPWLLDRADIFQKAICQLYQVISRADIPTPTQEAGLEELSLLAQSLDALLTNQVKLRQAGDDINFSDFEGYYDTGNNLTRRLYITQKYRNSFSEIRERYTEANCQILVKDVVDTSPRGRAIGGLDTQLRIGLRHSYVRSSDTYQWSISIDSGMSRGSGPSKQWQIIGPLSQAIHEAKLAGDSGIDLSDGPYTYHYYDPETIIPQADLIKYYWERKFYAFNYGLNNVFRSLAK